MRLVLVAPGFKSFPPQGWGAIESIVWDYYENLQSYPDIRVDIVNTNKLNEIVEQVNAQHADVVHIMYDDYIVVAPYLQCGKIVYTSHYAYLTHPQFETQCVHYFKNIFSKVIEYQDIVTIHVISEAIADVYINHGFKGKINIVCNGAREDKFLFSDTPIKKDKSVCVAKIEKRKAQYKYQGLPHLEFVGNFHDSSFNVTNPNYLGEWDKPTLYENLTNYSNLVLLSEGEADPLVVKEALVAGLGLVISECSTANLDLSMPFITVVPNNKLNDIFYVSEAVWKNRKTSIALRDKIRDYGLLKFSWKTVIKRYISLIK